MARSYLRVRNANFDSAILAVDYWNNLWISGSKYFGKTNGGQLSWFEVTADGYGHFWEWMSEDWQYVASFERMPLHQSDLSKPNIGGKAWIYRAPAVLKWPLQWSPYKDPWSIP